MKKEWLKIIEMLSSTLILPFMVSVFGTMFSYRWQEKKAGKKRIPVLQIVVLDSSVKLKVNKNTVEKCNPIIEIAVNQETVIDEMASSGSIQRVKFQKINYKDLQKSVVQSEMIFMGFKNADKDAFILRKLKYGQKIKEIDSMVVPVHNDEINNYCLVCRADQMPTMLQGSSGDYAIQYIIQSGDVDVRPEIVRSTR